MMSGVDAEFRASLDAMSEEELRDLRYQAYDLADIADDDVRAYARDAVRTIYAAEQRSALRRQLRDMCRLEAPDADPAAFVDALTELTRAQRELDSDTDVVETFAAAFDIARARGRAKGDGRG